jgi:predicted nucleic acid-binding Zn ribbon protein
MQKETIDEFNKRILEDEKYISEFCKLISNKSKKTEKNLYMFLIFMANNHNMKLLKQTYQLIKD